MVYTIFAASIAETSHPQSEPKALPPFVFGMMNNAVRAILAFTFNMQVAIIIIGCITLGSAILLKFRIQSPGL
jgi:hypothetical protein